MDSMSEESGHDEDSPKCVVCHVVLKNPVQMMKCGHGYCHLCFETISGYSKYFKSGVCCSIDREEIDIQENTSLLKKMCERLNKCEDGILEKEKDLVNLKFQLQQIEEKGKKREQEIDELKLKNVEMAREMNLVKDTNKKLQEDIEKMKTEQVLMKETHNLEEEKTQHLKAEIKEESGKLIESKNKESDSSKTQEIIKAVDNGLNNAEDVKAEKVMKINQESFRQVFQEIDELRAHINHADSLLYYEKNVSLNKKTTFVWRIHNIKEIFQARKLIESSKFYCGPKGHLCQLFGKFLAGSYKDMGIGLRLAKGKNSARDADFKVDILFELLYNDGTKMSATLSPADVDADREKCFTFPYYGDVSLGSGFGNFFMKDDMDKFVTDNTCTVFCTLTPSNSTQMDILQKT